MCLWHWSDAGLGRCWLWYWNRCCRSLVVLNGSGLRDVPYLYSVSPQLLSCRSGDYVRSGLLALLQDFSFFPLASVILVSHLLSRNERGQVFSSLVVLHLLDQLALLQFLAGVVV